MVELLENIEDLKEHVKYCRVVLYRIDEVINGFRLRVRAGGYAWDGTVKKEELEEILEWLKTIDAKKVKGSISDELFFA
jgi:hypothetical protein